MTWASSSGRLILGSSPTVNSFDITDGYYYLTSQSFENLIYLFWYTLVFEVPRYALLFIALAIAVTFKDKGKAFIGENTLTGHSLVTEQSSGAKLLPQHTPSISVLVIGHNEAGVIEKCVTSLHEQSLKDFEVVIVSDGSTDNMVEVSANLVRKGHAHRIISTDLRCGKSAAFNLCKRYSKGEILVNIDCDSELERTALERVIQPLLDDPEIGASSGNIIPRNGDVNLLTRFQVIEYLMSISVGRRTQQMFNQVTCLSGAFTAFRRSALDSVGDMDVGGGEDFDMTMRLRIKGWKIRFMADAQCHTAVPTSLWVLVRQRLRWERDSIRIRYRKHSRLMNPFRKKFQGEETFHQWDFLFFSVISALIYPFYLAYLFTFYGLFALNILVMTHLAFLFIDVIIFMSALAITRQWHLLPYLPYSAGYGVFNSVFMRMVRVWAYIQEWFLDSSRGDSFVPSRVAKARKW